MHALSTAAGAAVVASTAYNAVAVVEPLPPPAVANREKIRLRSRRRTYMHLTGIAFMVIALICMTVSIFQHVVHLAPTKIQAGGAALVLPYNFVVALGGEDGYARVSFTTKAPAECTVSFGNDAAHLVGKVSLSWGGDVASYACQDTDPSWLWPFAWSKCGPIGYHSGYVNVVKIGPLQVNQFAYYQVRCGSDGTSSVQRFFMPAATVPAAGDKPVTLALIGDVGQTIHSNLTYHRVAAMKPHAIIDAGDLSYADCWQPRWDSYANMVEHLSQTTPWHSVPGNHEIEGVEDCGYAMMGGEFVPYKVRRARAMPFVESGSSDPLYYSFDVGGVHFVMLSSYSDYSPLSAQHAWLRRDLSRVNHTRTPFIVAVTHAPWYQTNIMHQGEGDAMKASMEGVLLEYGVHLVVSGHVHAYERVHAVSSGAVLNQTCGIQYVVVGDGGNREGVYPFPSADTAPEWSAYREAAYGHGSLKVFNSTHAQFQWHRGADAATATPADESWLVNNQVHDRHHPEARRSSLCHHV